MSIYRHFKGNLYSVKGESIYSPKHCKGDLNIIYCIHTHFGNYVEIYKDKNGVMYHNFSRENMVIYKALNEDSDIYVRPSSDFYGELDKHKYPNANQKYRFERVGEHHDKA